MIMLNFPRFRMGIMASFLAIYSVGYAAENKVVVIPLNSFKNLKNVVTVAKKGGDFTDPVAAVESITDASVNNPYLVAIGPGVYTLTQSLEMKPYVAIAGSGRSNTLFTGSISSGAKDGSSAIVIGAVSSAISDVRIRNQGGGSYSIGIYNSSVAYDINRVEISAWGGTAGNYGMYNTNSSGPRITDSHVHGSGTLAYGVYNDSSYPTLNRVELSASVHEDLGGYAYGIGSFNSSHPSIRYSTLYGADYGLQQSGGTVNVSFSTFTSLYPVDTGGGAVLTCVYNDNNLGSLLDSTCHLVP